MSGNLYRGPYAPDFVGPVPPLAPAGPVAGPRRPPPAATLAPMPTPSQTPSRGPAAVPAQYRGPYATDFVGPVPPLAPMPTPSRRPSAPPPAAQPQQDQQPKSDGKPQRKVKGSADLQKLIDSAPNIGELTGTPEWQEYAAENPEKAQAFLARWHNTITRNSTRYKRATPELRAMMDARIQQVTTGQRPADPPKPDYALTPGERRGELFKQGLNVGPTGAVKQAVTGSPLTEARNIQPEDWREYVALAGGAIASSLPAIPIAAGATALGAPAAVAGAAMMAPGAAATAYNQYQSGDLSAAEAIRQGIVDTGVGALIGQAGKLPGLVSRNLTQTAIGTAGDAIQGRPVTKESIALDAIAGPLMDAGMGAGNLARRPRPINIDADLAPLALPPGAGAPPGTPALPPAPDWILRRGGEQSPDLRDVARARRTGRQVAGPEAPAGLLNEGIRNQIPNRFPDSPVFAGGDVPTPVPRPDARAEHIARLQADIAKIDAALSKKGIKPERRASLRQAREAMQREAIGLMEAARADQARAQADARQQAEADRITAEREARMQQVRDYEAEQARLDQEDALRAMDDPNYIPERAANRPWEAAEAEAKAQADYDRIRQRLADAERNEQLNAIDDPGYIPQSRQSLLRQILSDERGRGRIPTRQEIKEGAKELGMGALRGAEVAAKAIGKVSRAIDAGAMTAADRLTRAAADVGAALAEGRLPPEVVQQIRELGGVDERGRLKVGKAGADAVEAWFRKPLPEDSLGYKWRAAIVDRYGLSDAYLAHDQKRKLTLNQIARTGNRFVEQLRKAPESDRRILFDLLHNRDMDPGRLAALSEPIRKTIDELGERMVEAGWLSREAFERNKGQYLARAYQQFEAEKSQIGGRIVGAARRIQKKVGQMKGRGLFLDVSNSNLNRMPSKTENGKTFYQYKGEWFEVRGSRKGKTTIWRDWNKAERQQMGEIEDVSYAVLKTFDQLSKNVSTGEFYADVARDPRVASVDEVDGWVQVPTKTIPGTGGKQEWGKLAGMWVDPAVWRDLTEVKRLQAKTPWRSFMTQWKLNKTARNPVVHLNNIVSNMSLLELHGGHLDDAFTALRAIAGDPDPNLQRLYKEAQDAGVFGDTFLHQELQQQLRGLQLPAPRGGAEVKAATLARALYSRLKQVDDVMLDLYGAEDEVFRLALFMENRRRGLDIETAAADARAAFVDYDIRAPLINRARETVLPFLAYAYRTYPLLARSRVERPWKAAKLLLVREAANAVFSAMAGGNEAEERAAMEGVVHNASNMMRMPFKDSLGQQRYLDTTKFLPGSDLADPNEKTALPVPFPQALTPSGPLALPFQFAWNIDPFTGKPIRNEHTPLSEQWQQFGKYAYEQLMPNAPWVPGSYSGNKIANAITGTPDRYGRIDPPELALLSTLGVKTTGVDVPQLELRRAQKAQRDARAAEDVIRQAAMHLSQGNISQEQFERIQAQQMAIIQAAMQGLADYQRRLAELRGGDAMATPTP